MTAVESPYKIEKKGVSECVRVSRRTCAWICFVGCSFVRLCGRLLQMRIDVEELLFNCIDRCLLMLVWHKA